MSRNYMDVYVKIQEGEIEHTHELSARDLGIRGGSTLPAVNIDLTADGQIVGIEILNAKKTLVDGIEIHGHST